MTDARILVVAQSLTGWKEEESVGKPLRDA